MRAAPAPAAPATLADVVPLTNTRARSVVLVVFFCSATAAAAQLSISVSMMSAPVTGQRFVVLLSGAVLGWRLGAASQLLYIVVGGLGVPVFAAGASGWDVVTGATFGHLVGFVAAAAVVGALAERGSDRSLTTCCAAMAAGIGVIYLFSVPWIAHWSDVPVVSRAAPLDGIDLAVRPFLLEDMITAALAACLLPLAWQLHQRSQLDRQTVRA